MKYRCIPCDHVFEAENDNKPRCPECMGIHDIERAAASGDTGSGSGRKKIPLIVLGVVAAVAAIWFFSNDEKKDDGEAPLDAVEVADNLAAEMGLTREELAPCKANEAIAGYSSELTRGKKGREAATALAEALQDARRQGKWRPYHQREPRSERPKAAADFLDDILLGEPEQPYEASSLELACVLTAMVSAGDMDAQMMEITRFDDEKQPADPPGKFGRFGTALQSSEQDGTFEVFDPYTGRVTRTLQALPMTQAEVAGAYLGHAAFSLLAERLSNQAREKNDAAIKLAPASPYHRMTRGFIFLTSGIPNEAVAEFEKARKMRGDAVTRTNLAEVLLLVDYTGRRSEEILQSVLADNPEYVRALCMQAMVHVMRGEFDDARGRLASADNLEPDSAEIALYWSQFYVAQGQTEEGIEKAEQAVRLSGESEATLLSLATIYQRTARFDEMRATLDRLLAKVDSQEIRNDIGRLFNYDPDGEEDDEADEGAEAPSGSSGFQLKLGSDSQPGFGGGPGRKGLDLNLDLDMPSN